MADIIALDVSMGKSNVAWYHQKNCRDEFVFRHTQSGFNHLLLTVQAADHPTIFFEATGIYSNQLNAYMGIDIQRYRSGQGGHQDHINKRGNPIARKLLYFAIGNMIRQQHAAPNHIVDYYYHLKQKRPYPKLNKVAMVACMNKTLKCLLSMIKHHTKYHYRYTDSKSTVK